MLSTVSTLNSITRWQMTAIFVRMFLKYQNNCQWPVPSGSTCLCRPQILSQYIPVTIYNNILLVPYLKYNFSFHKMFQFSKKGVFKHVIQYHFTPYLTQLPDAILHSLVGQTKPADVDISAIFTLLTGVVVTQISPLYFAGCELVYWGFLLRYLLWGTYPNSTAFSYLLCTIFRHFEPLRARWPLFNTQ